MIETSIHLSRGVFRLLDHGPADGPLVLCLHGFPDFAPTFRPLLEALGHAGFHAVAPWMRGYAPSPRGGPYHADALAEDIRALALALSPNATVSLVGHDWGAVATVQALVNSPELFHAAVTMAVPHPISFLANALRTPAQLRRSAYMAALHIPGAANVARWNDLAFVDWLWRKWSPGFEPDPVEMRARKTCLAASFPGPTLYYRAMTWPPLSAFRRLRAARHQVIRTPVLHLSGAQDGCIAPSMARGQEAHFAGAFHAEVVPNAGHFLHIEQPEIVHARIVGFLKGSHESNQETRQRS